MAETCSEDNIQKWMCFNLDIDTGNFAQMGLIETNLSLVFPTR